MCENDSSANTRNGPLSNSGVLLLSAISTGLLIVLYWPFLAKQRDFVALDLSFIYQPVCQYIHQSLFQGRFPLWNDTVYCGNPQLAVISPGLFYLPNFLLFLLPFSLGMACYMAGHQLLVVITFYLYCRTFDLNKFAAALTSLSFAFCGYFFAMQKFPDYVGIAWIPCVVLSARYVFKLDSFKRSIALVMLCLSSAMLVMTGRPENFVPGLILCGTQVLADGYTRFRQQRKQAIMLSLLGLLGIIFGIMLSAPVILPELEWLRLSHRSHGLTAREAFLWSAKWYDWLSLCFWEPLGDLQLSKAGGPLPALIHEEMSRFLPFSASFYIGPAFCFCVLLGAFEKSFKLRFFFLAQIIFWGLIAAGDQAPFTTSLFSLFPQLFIIRYLVKFLVIPLLVSVPLAASGLGMILRRACPKGVLSLIILASCLCAAVLIATGTDIPESFVWYMSSVSATTLDAATINRSAENVYLSLTSGIFWLLGFSSIALLFQLQKIGKGFALFFLSAFMLSPLFLNGLHSYKRSAPFGFYEYTPALVQKLKSALLKSNSSTGQRIAFLESDGSRIMPEKYFANPELSDSVRALQFTRDSLESNANMPFALEYSDGWELAEIGLYLRLKELVEHASLQHADAFFHPSSKESDTPFARFCILTSSALALTKTSFKPGVSIPALNKEHFKLLEQDKDTDTRIYVLQDKCDRFYFADGLVSLPSWQEFIKLILDTRSTNKVRLSNAYALPDDVEKMRVLLSKEIFIQSQFADSMTKIALTKYLPEKFQLDIQKKHPGILVVRDQFYPGWKARIDGRETTIFQVNLFNRAIVVPAGSHVVEFEFVPASLVPSITSVVLALFGILALTRMIVKYEDCGKD